MNRYVFISSSSPSSVDHHTALASKFSWKTAQEVLQLHILAGNPLPGPHKSRVRGQTQHPSEWESRAVLSCQASKAQLAARTVPGADKEEGSGSGVHP